MNTKIGAVIVTRNRLTLLKECLQAVQSQSHPAEKIVVVNNGSTDGTHEWLLNHANVIEVIQDNRGSSGGQSAGIVTALQQGCDWVWLMDDDTIPDPDALARLVECPVFSLSSTGILCSDVRWVDGTTHLMNRPEIITDYPRVSAAFQSGALPISSASFVSLLVSRRAIEVCGLPLLDMFIWGDDVEFTRRISRKFDAFAIPASKVLHKTPRNYFADLLDPNPNDFEKLRYGVRNYIHNELRWRPPTFKSRVSLILLSGKMALCFWRKLPSRMAWILTQSLLKGYSFAPTLNYP